MPSDLDTESFLVVLWFIYAQPLEVKIMTMSAEAFHQLVRERRSVRGFRPDLIPEETLQSIFVWLKNPE